MGGGAADSESESPSLSSSFHCHCRHARSVLVAKPLPEGHTLQGLSVTIAPTLAGDEAKDKFRESKSVNALVDIMRQEGKSAEVSSYLAVCPLEGPFSAELPEELRC